MSQDTWRLFSNHCSPGGNLTAEQLKQLVVEAGLQQGEVQALFTQHAKDDTAGVPSLNYTAFLRLLQAMSVSNPNVWHIISKEAMEASTPGTNMESMMARVSALEDLINSSFSTQVESSTDSKKGAAVNHVTALTSIVNSIYSLTAGLKQVQSQQVEHTAMLQSLVDRVTKLEQHGGSDKSSSAVRASAVSACGQLQVCLKAVHASGDEAEQSCASASSGASTADAQDTLACVSVSLQEVQKTATQCATMVHLHEGALHVIHDRLAGLEGLNSQMWELKERIRHNKEELEQHYKLYHLVSAGMQPQPQPPSQPRALQSHGSLGRNSLGSRSSLTQPVTTDGLPMTSHFDPAPSAAEIQRFSRTKRSSQPGEQLHLDSPCIRTINQVNLRGRTSLTSPGLAPFPNATVPSPHGLGRPPVSERFKAIQDSELSNSNSSIKSEPAVPGELVLHATEFLSRTRLSSSGTAEKAVQQGSNSKLQAAPVPANGVLSSLPSPVGGSTNCTAEPPEGPTTGLAAVAQQLRAGPPRPPRLTVHSNGQGRTSSPNMSLPFSPNTMCP